MPTGTSVEVLPDEMILDAVFARDPLLRRTPFHDASPTSDDSDLRVLLTCGRRVSHTFDRLASAYYYAFRRFSHSTSASTTKRKQWRNTFLTRYDRLQVAAYVCLFALAFVVPWHSPQLEVEGFFEVVDLFRLLRGDHGRTRRVSRRVEHGVPPEIRRSLLQNKTKLEALCLEALMVPALSEPPPSLKMFHRAESERAAHIYYKLFISGID